MSLGALATSAGQHARPAGGSSGARARKLALISAVGAQWSWRAAHNIVARVCGGLGAAAAVALVLH